MNIIFVDCGQAFEIISRQNLMTKMKKMEISAKLIRLAKITMDGSQAKIITNQGTTQLLLNQGSDKHMICLQLFSMSR